MEYAIEAPFDENNIRQELIHEYKNIKDISLDNRLYHRVSVGDWDMVKLFDKTEDICTLIVAYGGTKTLCSVRYFKGWASGHYW